MIAVRARGTHAPRHLDRAHTHTLCPSPRTDDGKIQLREFLALYTRGLDTKAGVAEVNDCFAALGGDTRKEGATVESDLLKERMLEEFGLDVRACRERMPFVCARCELTLLLCALCRSIWARRLAWALAAFIGRTLKR